VGTDRHFFFKRIEKNKFQVCWLMMIGILNNRNIILQTLTMCVYCVCSWIWCTILFYIVVVVSLLKISSWNAYRFRVFIKARCFPFQLRLCVYASILSLSLFIKSNSMEISIERSFTRIACKFDYIKFNEITLSLPLLVSHFRWYVN